MVHAAVTFKVPEVVSRCLIDGTPTGTEVHRRAAARQDGTPIFLRSKLHANFIAVINRLNNLVVIGQFHSLFPLVVFLAEPVLPRNDPLAADSSAPVGRIGLQGDKPSHYWSV